MICGHEVSDVELVCFTVVMLSGAWQLVFWMATIGEWVGREFIHMIEGDKEVYDFGAWCHDHCEKKPCPHCEELGV